MTVTLKAPMHKCSRWFPWNVLPYFLWKIIFRIQNVCSVVTGDLRVKIVMHYFIRTSIVSSKAILMKTHNVLNENPQCTLLLPRRKKRKLLYFLWTKKKKKKKKNRRLEYDCVSGKKEDPTRKSCTGLNLVKSFQCSKIKVILCDIYTEDQLSISHATVA